MYSDNDNCQVGGNCASSSPFLKSTTGSGLLCGFWAAGSDVSDYSRCSSVKCRHSGQSYNLVTKLGFYFLPPVYYSTPVNQSYDMTDQSPSSSTIAKYDGSAVAGQPSATDQNAFVFTSLCPNGGSNIGTESQAVVTGGRINIMYWPCLSARVLFTRLGVVSELIVNDK